MMEDKKTLSDLFEISYQEDQNVFHLKKAPSIESEINDIVVENKIRLSATINGKIKKVNTNLPLDSYEMYEFINPFLNAQNDIFRVKFLDKTIGQMFPAYSLEIDVDEEDFNEMEQAYRFYCINKIIQKTDATTIDLKDDTQTQVQFSKFIDPDSIYLVIYKPSINSNFNIENVLPSLASKGYYFYPIKTKSNANGLFDNSPDESLKDLVQNRFHKQRGHKSITLKSSRKLIQEEPLIKLLYVKLLSTSPNTLHRFLLLYQIIEHLTESKFKEELDKVLKKKDDLSNFKFIQKVNEVYSARANINKLINDLVFEDKNEITQIFKDFILEFDNEYDKSATGDCLYDIRNLLFHDFKSILNNNKQNAIDSIIIRFEILIHGIVMSLGETDETVEEAASPLQRKSIVKLLFRGLCNIFKCK